MLSLEEEAFTLHVLDSLELLGVDKRLLKILDAFANSTEDIKSVFKRLRNYSKDINKKNENSIPTPSNLFKTHEIFERLVEELNYIGQVLKWDEGFLSILKYYLSTRNITITINFLSSYNTLHELNLQLEEQLYQVKVENQ